MKNIFQWNGWYVNMLVGIVFVCILGAIGVPRYESGRIKRDVARVNGDFHSIESALESYYVDNGTYPRPDYDKERQPVVPHYLTSPVSYVTRESLLDPFREKGKGYYEYGGDGFKRPYSSESWLLTSFGPDRVDGNSGIPGGKILDEENAYLKKDPYRFPLIGSSYTYDPSNGLVSPGDIWLCRYPEPEFMTTFR